MDIQEMHDATIIRELRRRGCAVAVFFPEELPFASTDEMERRYLESYMAEMGMEYIENYTSKITITRLSIPGNECTHCGTIMTEKLKCPGCGWNDPMTRRKA